MISKLENPPLMVIAALRFRSPFGLLFLFSKRWRRFRRFVKRSPGVLLYQETVLKPDGGIWPRTFMTQTWFRDVESLRAFNRHAEHQRMIAWSKTQQYSFDVWIEEYILRAPGVYQGQPGPLWEALQAGGIALQKASA